MGRSLIIDIWTALLGLGAAALILHNPAAAEGEARGFLTGYTGALNTVGNTR